MTFARLNAQAIIAKEALLPVLFRSRMDSGLAGDLADNLAVAAKRWLSGMHAYNESEALLRTVSSRPGGFAIANMFIAKRLIEAIRPETAQWVVDMSDLRIEGVTLVEILLPDEPKPTLTVIHSLPANLDLEGLKQVLVAKGCQVISATRDTHAPSGLPTLAVKVEFAPGSVVPGQLTWPVREGEVRVCRVDIISMLPRPAKPATYASAARGPPPSAPPKPPAKRGLRPAKKPAQAPKKPTTANAAMEAKAIEAKAKLERQRLAKVERERIEAERLSAQADAKIAARVAAAAEAAAVAKAEKEAEEQRKAAPPPPEPPAPVLHPAESPEALPQPRQPPRRDLREATSESEPEDMTGAPATHAGHKRRKTSTPMEEDTSGAQAGAAHHQNA